MNYKEQAEQFRVRLAAEKSAEVAEKERVKRDEEARKISELHEKNSRIREYLRMLDSLGAREMLEGVNRDIWGGKGYIETDEIVEEATNIITGKTISLRTVIYDGRSKTEYVYRDVYGPYTVSRVEYSPGGDGWSTDSYTGWHKQAIGEKVIGIEKYSTTYSLSILFKTDHLAGPLLISISDNTFNLDPFKVPDIPFSNRGGLSNNRHTYQIDKPSYGSSEIGLVFGSDGFDYEIAKSFINHGLISHSSHRLEKPLETEFERAELHLANLRNQIGTINYDHSVPDPTPVWRRLFRP